MKHTLLRFAGITLGVVIVVNSPARAEDAKSKEEMAKMAEMYKPSAQMQLLSKGRVGKWTYHCKMTMDPSQPPMEMNGGEEISLLQGGLWAITRAHSTVPMPFDGTGVCGWNVKKAKFEGNWVDNMSMAMSTFEGDMSEDGKSATYTMIGPDMTGETVTSTMKDEITDANHRSWRSWKGTDTSGPPMMEMMYTRITGKTGKAK